MATAESSPDRTSGGFAADKLAVGIAIMLVITIVQRGLGFGRGIWFCRVLDDAVVGRWSMAHDFICMITPMILLGMPGSLPRYVEHYRMRGHLRGLVTNLLIVTSVLGIAAWVMMTSAAPWFGWLLFLDSQSTSLVHALATAMLVTIGFYFLQELITGLRQIRVSSWMQFTQSVGFTVLAVIWLAIGGGLTGVIYAFALATVLAWIPALIALASGWSGLAHRDEPIDRGAMWRRIVPFAMSLWSLNLLTNAFGLSDRYMILHLLPDQVDAQAAVGQYHSARIFPMLLMNVAAMVAGVLLPYLTADWEQGRKRAVMKRLHQILLGISVSFTAGAAIVMWTAPWIFETLLQGRYGDGLALMPMVFVFSIWFALANIGENYLWVIERGKWAAVAMAAGLVVNLGLNLWLLPILGLPGAVLATLLSNGIMLVGIWSAMLKHGFAWNRNVVYVTLLPATLLAGFPVALVCCGLVVLFHRSGRRWLQQAIANVQLQWAGRMGRGTNAQPA